MNISIANDKPDACGGGAEKASGFNAPKTCQFSMFWIWMPLVGVLVAVRDSISCFIVFVGLSSCQLSWRIRDSARAHHPLYLFSVEQEPVTVD